MEDYFSKAIKNIAKYGDTDIFPFPFERYLFQEKHDDVVSLLMKIHQDFDSFMNKEPPITINKMSPVGYFGFRKATFIEPFWNAYFLGLVSSLAEKIEEKRISIPEKVVFSYRYEWNESECSFFNDLNWIDYKKQCVENAKSSKFIIQTDISDFYPRVNHHKLENELRRIEGGSLDITKRIMKLLSGFTNTISYGLPVGGPASRILAELALRHVDEHLKNSNIKFCRYVDDYTIFCSSESEAYKNILFLTEKLANDQLTLQKNKTRIMSSNEFLETYRFLDPMSENESSEEQKLLNVSIRFDPYSSSAEEDYDTLKQAISEIDIVGILSKEIHKTSVDQTVTKQAINAIKALDTDKQLQAVFILLDEKNLITLSPVFSTMLRSFRSIYNDLPNDGKDKIDSVLINLFDEDNYLIKIDLNVSYIIQILSLKKTDSKIRLMTRLYLTSENPLIKRQIIITMSNWNCDYWLSDIKNNYIQSSLLEKRAIIYSSFHLNDEGKHWRDHNKKLFSDKERLICNWFSVRKQQNKMVLA